MKNKNKICLFALPLVVASLAGCGAKQTTASITYAGDSAPIAFGVSEIKDALARNNVKCVESGGDYNIVINDLDSTLGEQGYKVKVDGKTINVTGGDATGAMYGAMQVAENINIEDGMSNMVDAEGTPYIGLRGVRCRLLTDMRTPCYINNSNSAWANIENTWDINYWNDYFALLARKRYNLVNFATVNSLASMVKVPGYEDCALDDVWAYDGEYNDGYYGNVTNMFQASQLDNYHVVKKMTIDEKTKFWYDVFQSANDHGIKVQFGAMNIYAFAEMQFAPQYGITVDNRENEVTKDYLRKGYTALLKAFPQIEIFGAGEGENMDYPSGTELQTHQWIYDVYGKAVLDAITPEDPRYNSFTTVMGLSTEGEDSPYEKIWTGFPFQRCSNPRYSDVHMYAITDGNQNDTSENVDEHSTSINTLPSYGKVLFNTRNEDAYHYTWGDPDFLRDYCKNMYHEKSLGFFLGTDGYFLGKEYEFKDESLNGGFYYDRHWVNYTGFGRFSYDPTITNEYFEKMVIDHYENGNVKKETIKKAYEIMQEGSKFLPELQKEFTLRGTDAAWYPGNCQSHPTMGGYIGVKKMVNSDNVFYGAEDRNISIADYAKALLNGEEVKQKNPYQVAQSLADIHNAIDAKVKEWESMNAVKSTALNQIIEDQKTVSLLSDYYSSKMEGAMNLRRYNDTKDTSYQERSIKNHQDALEKWKKYSDSFLSRFIVERLPRVGVIDPAAYTSEVEKDISVVQKWKCRTY